MVKCPNCGAEFSTEEEHATHHKRAHPESSAEEVGATEDEQDMMSAPPAEGERDAA